MCWECQGWPRCVVLPFWRPFGLLRFVRLAFPVTNIFFWCSAFSLRFFSCCSVFVRPNSVVIFVAFFLALVSASVFCCFFVFCGAFSFPRSCLGLGITMPQRHLIFLRCFYLFWVFESQIRVLHSCIFACVLAEFGVAHVHALFPFSPLSFLPFSIWAL